MVNVITQDDQLAVFAARASGWSRRVLPGGGARTPAPPGARGGRLGLHPRPGSRRDRDSTTPRARSWSHHWIEAGGRLVRHSAPYRYVWPSELDLMAKITGPGSGTAGQAGTERRSLRQPKPGRRIREAAVASWHAQSDQVCAGQQMPVTSLTQAATPTDDLLIQIEPDERVELWALQFHRRRCGGALAAQRWVGAVRPVLGPGCPALSAARPATGDRKLPAPPGWRQRHASSAPAALGLDGTERRSCAYSPGSRCVR